VFVAPFACDASCEDGMRGLRSKQAELVLALVEHIIKVADKVSSIRVGFLPVPQQPWVRSVTSSLECFQLRLLSARKMCLEKWVLSRPTVPSFA
jgi:hypothetical protein